MKVVLIVDNCPAHSIIEVLYAVELGFLSPNIISKIQPMGQGVIRSVKAKYRRNIIQRLIRAVDMKKAFLKPSILDSIQLLQSPWSKLSETIIKNCFRKEIRQKKQLMIKLIRSKTLPLKNLKKPSMSFVKDCPMKLQRS